MRQPMLTIGWNFSFRRQLLPADLKPARYHLLLGGHRGRRRRPNEKSRPCPPGRCRSSATAFALYLTGFSQLAGGLHAASAAADVHCHLEPASSTIPSLQRSRRLAHHDPGAFEPIARSQVSAGWRSENVIDVSPRFEATCAPNPVTSGGLPISATFG
jgi:hypothetical protein